MPFFMIQCPAAGNRCGMWAEHPNANLNTQRFGTFYGHFNKGMCFLTNPPFQLLTHIDTRT